MSDSSLLLTVRSGATATVSVFRLTGAFRFINKYTIKAGLTSARSGEADKTTVAKESEQYKAKAVRTIGRSPVNKIKILKINPVRKK
jgi:hypothetical protein